MNGSPTSCAASLLNGSPPASSNQPRETRANRRPGQRRRPGAGPRKGRRPSTRPTPSPPTHISARQPRWPNGEFARWGFVPPDSQRANHGLPKTARRRTKPAAGPSRLDNSKALCRSFGDETPTLSCQLTVRISCVAGEPRPRRPTTSGEPKPAGIGHPVSHVSCMRSLGFALPNRPRQQYDRLNVCR